jgi:hypothetical protein
MRGSLYAFMIENPARIPIRLYALDLVRAVGRRMQNTKLIEAMAVLLLIVGVGAGTSNAAEGSLPGDLLYPVKVSFNEPVEGVFAVSQAAKNSWDMKLADRRLSEAEVLAAQGRLTPVVSKAAQAQLDSVTRNLDTSNNAAQDVADVSHASSAATAQAQLETSLSAHAQVLTALTAAVPSSKTEIAPILTSVENSVKAARVSRAQATGRLAAADIAEVLRSSQYAKAGTEVSAAIDTSDASDTVSTINASTTLKAASTTEDASSTPATTIQNAGVKTFPGVNKLHSNKEKGSK